MMVKIILLVLGLIFISYLSADELLLGDTIKSFVDVTGAAKLRDYFQNAPKETFKMNASKFVKSFARRLEEKTNISTSALSKLRKDLILQYNQPTKWLKRQAYSCCRYPKELLQISSYWRRPVDDGNVCDMAPEDQGNCMYTRAHDKQENVLNILKGAFDSMNRKSDHVFFADERSGIYVQYPAMNATLHGCEKCLNYDPRLRSWYTGALTPTQGKIIVIVAHFKEENVLVQQKKVLQTILDTIGSKDKVVLMVISKQSIASYPNNNCLSKLETATPNIIQKLKDFIDKQKSNKIDNNTTQTFKNAFNHFKEEDNAKTKKKVIIFVTSSRDPTRTVSLNDIIKAISRANDQSAAGRGLILLLTVANEDLSRNSYDAYEQIATQNKKRMGLHYHMKGEINDAYIRNIRHNIFALTVDNKNEVQFTLPYFDINGLGRMISACIPLYDETLHGVACIAFLSSELLNIKSVPEFEESMDSYTFLVDEQGITYMHPKYEEPILENDKAFPVNIKNFETAKAYDEIYQSMNESSALPRTKEIPVNVSVARGDVAGGSKLLSKTYTYSWKKIANSPFWLTVVVSSLNKVKIKLGEIKSEKNQTTLYHRFNLPFWKLCKLKGVYLADSSCILFVREVYLQPLLFYKQQTLTTIQNLMDYFDGKSSYKGNLLQDPSTAKSLRKYVIATNVLNDIWKNLIFKDILRVYVGLSNGFFRIFPGDDVHIDYDPRIRPWYRLAINSDEDYAVTAPYADYATNIPTISMAKRIYMSQNSTQVVGVYSVDVGVTWLIQHVSREENCKDYGHSCIIIDKSGSLIYHESFENTVDLNRLHITQMEPHLSRDLLRKGHMVKEHCIGYHKVTLKQTETIAHYQWFYKLDHITSTIDEMDGDSKSCVRYTITPIKQTNLLLIALQNRCTIDFPCLCTLNKDAIPVCHKFFPNGDSLQCECPCYDFLECTADVPRVSTLLCQPPNFRLGIAVDDYHNWQQFDQNKCHIKECNAPTLPTCNPSSSKSQCNGSSCQWCHKTADGESLSNPFCSEKSTCIRGFLQSCEVNDDDKNSDENRKITIATVIVVVLFIIVLFGILYWRGNLKCITLKYTPKGVIFEVPQTTAQTAQSQRNEAYLEEFEPRMANYTPSNISRLDDSQYGGSQVSV